MVKGRTANGGTIDPKDAVHDLTNEPIPSLPSANPNLPKGAKTIPIHLASVLYHLTVNSVHVFPEHLDLERFKKSVQVLTSVAPQICATFCTDPNPPTKGKLPDYYFDLVAQPIPFSYQYSDLEDPYPGTEYEFHQASLDPYVHGLAPESIEINTGAPLVSFRLTFFKGGKSCLGFTLGHIVGDAASQQRLLSLLSDIYANGGILPDLKADEYPSFDIGLKIKESPQASGELEHVEPGWRCQIFEHATSGPEEFGAWFAKHGWTSELKHISVSLSSKEIKALKANCQNHTKLTLSSVDSIISWLCSLHVRAMGVNIDTQVAVFNLRALSDTVKESFLGDAVCGANIDISSSKTGCSTDERTTLDSMAFIASRTREAINRFRNDEAYRQGWLDYELGTFVAKSLIEGKDWNFIFPKDQIYINSYARFDFAVTFGFAKDQVRAHQCQALLRAPRVNMANLRPGQRLEERGYAIDFEVEVEYYDKTVKLVEEDTRDFMV